MDTPPVAASAAQGPSLPPGLFLRGDRRDWTALLVLWCCREGGRCLLILGLIPPMLSGQFNHDLVSRLDSPSDLAAALVSPLMLLAIGILLRATVSITALIIAVPINARDMFDGQTTPPRSRTMRAYDVFTLASGKKTLRWSWAVRRTAAARLGSSGRALELTGRALSWLTPVCIAVVVAVGIIVYG